MEYRILGKLDVLRDGESIDLGAFRQRALLAMLLTSPNSVQSTDQLIDGRVMGHDEDLDWLRQRVMSWTQGAANKGTHEQDLAVLEALARFMIEGGGAG